MVFVMYYTKKVASLFRKTPDELVAAAGVDVVAQFLFPLYKTSMALAKEECALRGTKGGVFGPSGRGGV